MKRLLLIILFSLRVTSLIQAQDTLQVSVWKQTQQQRYFAYKDSVSAAYQQFLDQHWSEYRLYQSLHRATSKPAEQPRIDTLRQEISFEHQAIPMEPLHIQDVSLLEDSSWVPHDALEHLQLRFYGRKVSVGLPIGIPKLKLPGSKERQVVSFWDALASAHLSEIVPQLTQLKKELYLNDWGIFDLIRHLSAQVYPSHTNAQMAFAVNLLNQMHFDVRLGRIGNDLLLLVPALQTVYEQPFVTLKGKRYYVIDIPQGLNPSSLMTYASPYPKATASLDLNLYSSPRIGGSLTTTPYCYVVQGKTVKIPINAALMEFYSRYPQTELQVYANAAVEEAMGLAMETQIRSLIAASDKYISLSNLLLFMQQGFGYESDSRQFGHEKTLFCEENFYYGASDCEDRAILFSYLVRRLLNFDVVLLAFDDHVATAVCLDDDKIKGDYYLLNKRKYVVCDPTTRGALVGQIKSKYKNQTPNMILLKTNNKI